MMNRIIKIIGLIIFIPNFMGLINTQVFGFFNSEGMELREEATLIEFMYFYYTEMCLILSIIGATIFYIGYKRSKSAK